MYRITPSPVRDEVEEARAWLDADISETHIGSLHPDLDAKRLARFASHIRTQEREREARIADSTYYSPDMDVCRQCSEHIASAIREG